MQKRCPKSKVLTSAHPHKGGGLVGNPKRWVGWVPTPKRGVGLVEFYPPLEGVGWIYPRVFLPFTINYGGGQPLRRILPLALPRAVKGGVRIWLTKPLRPLLKPLPFTLHAAKGGAQVWLDVGGSPPYPPGCCMQPAYRHPPLPAPWLCEGIWGVTPLPPWLKADQPRG